MTIAAVRYNNPGNVSLPIQGWSGGGSIVGISGQPGYAAFPDMQTGLAALDARVTNYIDVKGLNTIGQLNSVYAQDGNWAAGVSANSGIGINTPLDTSNAAQMNSLQGAIIKQETGMDPGSFGFGSSGAVQAPAAPSVGSNLPDAGAVTPDANSGVASQGAAGLPTSNGFDQSSLNNGDPGLSSGGNGIGFSAPDGSGVSGVGTAAQSLGGSTVASVGPSSDSISGASTSAYSDPSTPIAAETPDAATPATQAGSANVAGTWDATGAAAVSAAGSAVAKSDASAASSITSALGGAVKSLTSALNSTSQAAAKTSVQNDQSIQNTGTGWINTLLLNTKDLFQRGMIGFFGLILLLGAALYFAKASANERTA